MVNCLGREMTRSLVTGEAKYIQLLSMVLQLQEEVRPLH
jgi:hypothetical protein